MEEQERLTMELVKSLMDKSYTLVWVDYNDNLDNCPMQYTEQLEYERVAF